MFKKILEFNQTRANIFTHYTSGFGIYCIFCILFGVTLNVYDIIWMMSLLFLIDFFSVLLRRPE